jgi:transcriptional regulator with XRE-family HTH domain
MLRVLGDSLEFAIGHSSDDRPQNSAVPKTTIRTFWQRVEEALRERGLPTTQAYVARHLKIKPPSVNEWTRIGGYPTIENTISLAEHLGVTAEWLLTERGPKRPPPQDATAQRLWDIWPRLSDGDKRELIGQALGMLRRTQDAAPSERRRA